MRFKTIAFALIVSSAVFILGCDDDDSSTVDGGMQMYFEATVSPPMDSAIIKFGSLPAFYQSTSTGLVVGTYYTDVMPVTKGQEIPVYVELQYANWLNGSACSNVEIKALLNGSQFDVRTFNMGGSANNQTCCPDFHAQQYTLTIP